MALFSVSIKTPLGHFHMIIERAEGEASSLDVVRASGFGTRASLWRRLSKHLRFSTPDRVFEVTDHPHARVVERYFRGDMKSLALIPLKQEGSDFRQKIWRVMGNVGAGKTVSYKELAVAAGNGRAIRATGSACAQNLLCLLVPCHRIVRSDGSMGKYLYGSKAKAYLLNLEKASVQGNSRVLGIY